MTAPHSSTAVELEFDVETDKKVLHMRFRGKVRADHMRARARDLEQTVRALGPGFTLVTDLTELANMDLECVPHITHLMDTCLAAGIGKVIRIIPDPDKDIGFNLLSLVHYRGRVRTITCETREEAEREFARA